MILKVQLPGTKMPDIQLDVRPTYVRLLAPKFRLKVWLPAKVDETGGNAKEDAGPDDGWIALADVDEFPVLPSPLGGEAPSRTLAAHLTKLAAGSFTVLAGSGDELSETVKARVDAAETLSCQRLLPVPDALGDQCLLMGVGKNHSRIVLRPGGKPVHGLGTKGFEIGRAHV